MAAKDGRPIETQNERQDADRFAKQQLLRNRTFRKGAQDVHWEWAEGSEGWEGQNVAAKDGRPKETQNERQDADRFAKQQTLRNRTFRKGAQEVHCQHVTTVDLPNPYPTRLRFTTSVCPSPRFPRGLGISQGRGSGKQELRQDTAILTKQINLAKQDISQTQTGSALYLNSYTPPFNEVVVGYPPYSLSRIDSDYPR